MAISFTKSVSGRLNQEIADMESNMTELKKKREKASVKINQLEKDCKLSTSPSDLSSKMSRINKLQEDIKKFTRLQAELSKEMAKKKSTLAQLPPVK
jgi:chromosome segregation ATPase